MGFHEEGTFTGVIKQAFLAESKFNPDTALDAALEIESPQGTDWWLGEISQNYPQSGNNADKTWGEITIENLTKIGLPNGDISQIGTLVGKEIPFTVKQSKCGKYFNIKYIGSSSFTPKAIDPAQLAAKYQAIFSGAPAAPTPPPPTTNPFAAPAKTTTNPFVR